MAVMWGVGGRTTVAVMRGWGGGPQWPLWEGEDHSGRYGRGKTTVAFMRGREGGPQWSF